MNRKVDKKDIEKVIRNFLIKAYQEDCISAYAGQICYFLVLSAVPFIILLGWLIQYTPASIDTIHYIIEQITPEYVTNYVTEIVDTVYSQSAGVISVSAIFAIWSASKGVHCIVNALNQINNLRETRNWFLIRLRAIIFTSLFLVVVIVLMMLLVFGTNVAEMTNNYDEAVFAKFISFLLGRRFLIIFVLLVAFFTFMFKFLPNSPQNSSVFYQLPGAVGCAASWYVFTFFLSIFVKLSNSFSWYGSLASLMIITFWLYICLTIMLICAEVNVIFEIEFRVLYAKLKEKKSVRAVHAILPGRKENTGNSKRTYKKVHEQYREQFDERNRALEVQKLHHDEEVKNFRSGFSIVRNQYAHFIDEDEEKTEDLGDTKKLN
ncbi:YihY/virulence factor BrkB family protein [Eubacterium oxidoreducens]|uniref:Membrane protein n=1 Tax=Eubacterium oxidoreducens TaxID=1732 RepID=A0A1G6AKG8_EUBOX|nr:YihY/virulence factor BrkB family protein [Eubacterium oxidoreducens]SDB08891.1 membrane protein [Eubacterium oxidoreducens]